MTAPDFERTKKVDGVSAMLDCELYASSGCGLLSDWSALTRDTPSIHGRVLLQHSTYTSQQRTAALRLCGWSFAVDNNMEEFVKRYIIMYYEVGVQ